MKSKLLYMVLFSVIVMLADCSRNTEKEPENVQNKCTKYACPNHPDKTSFQLEKCPECDRQMILIPDSLINDSLTKIRK